MSHLFKSCYYFLLGETLGEELIHSMCNFVIYILNPFCDVLRRGGTGVVYLQKIVFENCLYLYLRGNDPILNTLDLITTTSLGCTCMEKPCVFVTPLYQSLLTLCLHFISSFSKERSISFSNDFITAKLGDGCNCCCLRLDNMFSKSFLEVFFFLASHFINSRSQCYSLELKLTQQFEETFWFCQAIRTTCSPSCSNDHLASNLKIFLHLLLPSCLLVLTSNA